MEERKNAHPPEAILDINEVAEWIGVSPRTVERLDLPCIHLGHRIKRYLGKDVLEYMEERKAS
jgi:predicted DNA-binding transcriptional regulator AlpA